MIEQPFTSKMQYLTPYITMEDTENCRDYLMGNRADAITRFLQKFNFYSILHGKWHTYGIPKELGLNIASTGEYL